MTSEEELELIAKWADGPPVESADDTARKLSYPFRGGATTLTVRDYRYGKASEFGTTRDFVVHWTSRPDTPAGTSCTGADTAVWLATLKRRGLEFIDPGGRRKSLRLDAEIGYTHRVWDMTAELKITHPKSNFFSLRAITRGDVPGAYEIIAGFIAGGAWAAMMDRLLDLAAEGELACRPRSIARAIERLSSKET